MTLSVDLDDYLAYAIISMGLIGKAQKIILLYDDDYPRFVKDIAQLINDEG